MALFKKAMAHHTLAGKAIKNLDHATAMKHVGHMLHALKATSGTDAMGADAMDTPAMPSSVPPPNLGTSGATPAPAPVNPLRARLAGFRPKGMNA